ncbi:MAG: DUF4253 domain-containing protein, partial [Gracilibacteraceae bacterium]|nr:DUF4253 domain-containing protein [Gracilibacteraceae bacterium]
ESETLQKTLADLEAFRNAEEITPSKDCAALMEYLDCPCRVFTGLLDDDDMVFAYEQAAMRGKAESFTPLLIVVSDILTEAVAMAADENDDLPDREKGRAWRKEVLRKAEEIDAKAFLDSRFKEYADDEGNGEYAEEIKTLLNRTLKGKDTRRRVSAFWDYEAQLTKEVILAEIPTAKPYELAAYVPMGGFNDCPDPETQVAVMKRWYEKYGAIPAVVTYDEWEFIVPEPLADEAEALVLAAEHFAFCADRLEQYRNGYTLGMLAKSLTDSTVWYFWWD